MSADGEDRLVTLSEAATLTDVSRSTIRRYLDEDKFPGARQDDDGRAAWRVPVSDLEDAGLTVDRGHEQDASEVAGEVDQSATRVMGEVAPGTALVPLSELSELFQQVSNAEARAARAEAVLAFTEEQLAEARTAAREAADDPGPGPAWLVPAGLVVAVALAVVALVIALAGA